MWVLRFHNGKDGTPAYAKVYNINEEGLDIAFSTGTILHDVKHEYYERYNWYLDWVEEETE